MGLVTDDLTSLLTDPKLTDPKEETQENPFGATYTSPLQVQVESRWHQAVHRLRKWLKSTFAAHGEDWWGQT
jgi:hypothetical protein